MRFLDIFLLTTLITTCKLHFVRYADDWICTASSKEILEQKVLPTVIAFLKERGLKLSLEKTKITHIDDGFDFLGCNLRKYKGKLLIKPGRKGVKSFISNIRNTISSLKSCKAEDLINILNPKIIGWANHYSHIVSKKTFSYIDSEIFKSLWRWAKRRHPNKSISWIKQKYFTRIDQRDWLFFAKSTETTKDKRFNIKLASDVLIKRHVKICADANPYNLEYKDYFKDRSQKQMNKANCRTTKTGLRGMRAV